VEEIVDATMMAVVVDGANVEEVSGDGLMALYEYRLVVAVFVVE
jgi:hypothetical protein